MKETIHDWDSYESASFGTLNSTFTSEFDDPEYRDMFITYIPYKELTAEKMKEEETYQDLYSDWAVSKRKKIHPQI
ncbi:hypothetical protein [Dysgonomonas macrotermitis]|uniref:Uncharacterized protein n=1 Tax=Dysgonomonas macrotermitis TaxID=1346286 RepID=A0A1M5JWB1_9BACT|nr:hypothetical protein [Dysgonomonas macrotermitis]SHG44882.1 hypothetical protein SAMN05444362_1303 [Dysgonomonas macrotermitis]